MELTKLPPRLVAPYTGAWIEIYRFGCVCLTAMSHPTRVRGLKFVFCFVRIEHDQSHPTRVRGLKFIKSQKHAWKTMSHPTRVRGLKFNHLGEGYEFFSRTLHGCVDWNLLRSLCCMIDIPVAPYTGAWIEIQILPNTVTLWFVAPYTGAWIEIYFGHSVMFMHASHPTRVRGLKYLSLCCMIDIPVAPYTGAWIEIQILPNTVTLWFVAPYTGAWIEIRPQ